MPDVTYGVMNETNARPPKPPASPHDFAWPDPKEATNKDRRAFAASLQELLPAKEWNHARLAAALWGTDKYTSRNIAKSRNWVRADGMFPNAEEAAYVAELLDVPMARLMEPEGNFSSAPALVRKHRGFKGKKGKATKEKKAKGGWGVKRRAAEEAKHNLKANGHDHTHDQPWQLPDGVELPAMKLETSKEHSGLYDFELKGAMPLNVAMAVMAMVKQELAKHAE